MREVVTVRVHVTEDGDSKLYHGITSGGEVELSTERQSLCRTIHDAILRVENAGMGTSFVTAKQKGLHPDVLAQTVDEVLTDPNLPSAQHPDVATHLLPGNFGRSGMQPPQIARAMGG